jgi:hypothetical protein
VKNPSSTKPSGNFNIVSKYSEGYEIEKGAIQVTVSSAADFNDLSVSRSNTEISKPITLIFSFKITNPLFNNDKITISLPKDLVQWDATISTSLKLLRLAPSASSSNSAFSSTENSTYVSISFSENICSPCTEGTL